MFHQLLLIFIFLSWDHLVHLFNFLLSSFYLFVPFLTYSMLPFQVFRSLICLPLFYYSVRNDRLDSFSVFFSSAVSPSSLISLPLLASLPLLEAANGPVVRPVPDLSGQQRIAPPITDTKTHRCRCAVFYLLLPTLPYAGFPRLRALKCGFIGSLGDLRSATIPRLAYACSPIVVLLWRARARVCVF